MSDLEKKESAQEPAQETPFNTGANELPIVRWNRKYILIPKVLYLTLYMAYYTCYTFKFKFFKDVLGIKEDDASFIYGAAFIVVAFGSVFWNNLADRTARPKMCVTISALLMAASFQLFLILPAVGKGAARDALQVLIIMLWTFAYSSLQPLMDAVVVHQLKVQGHGSDLYGRQRLWGTVGYGLVTCLVGFAIDGRSAKTVQEVSETYKPMFWIVAGMTLVFVILFQLLIANDDPVAELERRKLERIEKERANPNCGAILTKKQQLAALLSNPEFVFLLVITLFVGYGRQSLSMLRPIYTEDYILGNDSNKKTWVSLAAVTGLLFEVVVFFWGKPLLKRIGKYWLMVAALFTIAVRLWAYYFMPEGNRDWIYFILVIELLKGMSMGTLQIAAVQMCADVAGPDLQATAQGIFTGVFNGISGVAGGMGSGAILKVTKNYKIAFLLCAVLTTLTLGMVFVWPLIQRVLIKRRRN